LRPRRRVEPTRPTIPHSRINEDIRVSQVRLVDADGGQLGVKPIAEALEYAHGKDLDLVEVDDSDETVGKRIRNAEVEKIPYVVVWGDKESEDAIAVRTHGGDQSTKSLNELLAEFRQAATV